MSCIVHAFAKVVAFPVKLTAKILGRLSNRAAKATARAGKSCGKCGAKACKKCLRSSGRTCKIFRKHCQKACSKSARTAKSICRRCGRKFPKRCRPMLRWKKCSKFCTQCRKKHSKCNAIFKKPACLCQGCVWSQRCLNQRKHRGRNADSRKFPNGRRLRKVEGSSKGIEGTERQLVGHEDRPSQRKADKRLNLHQSKNGRKGDRSPKFSKRRLPSRSTPESGSSDKVREAEQSTVKLEKHKKVARNRKEESKARKEAGRPRSSVVAHTAGFPMSKASLAASEGKDSDGIERQQISSLEGKSRKRKAGSQACSAAHEREAHATREDSQAGDKNEASRLHPPRTREQINNPNTNLPSKRNRAREPKHSNEHGAHVSGTNSADGIKQRQHQKAKPREQTTRQSKGKAVADVVKTPPAEAELPHRKASLQHKDSVAEINRNAKEHSEKFHWAPREERSSQGKQRNDPEGMDKTVEEAECPKNDGSLKQHSTRVQKQKKSDDAKQCSMVDKPKSLAAPVAEAIEKKKKSEKQRHNSNAAKNVISRHTMETPRQDVSEGSCKLQRGNAASNQTNGNNLELKKDGLALPCTGETKLPKAAKAADPMPTSHKITIESQGIQSEPVAGTGPAEQRLTSGCQNRESHFCEDKQLADQTTLFGIECRVRPESAHSAKWISFA